MDTSFPDKEQRQRLLGLVRLGYSFPQIAQIEKLNIVAVVQGIDRAKKEEANAGGAPSPTEDEVFAYWDDEVESPPQSRWVRLALFVHRLGYSTTEIAKVMGVEQQGLKNYLSRAKREEKLEQEWRREQGKETG